MNPKTTKKAAGNRDDWRKPAREAVALARGRDATALSEYEAKQLLAKYRIPVPRGTTFAEPSEVSDIALSDLNPPLVAKLLTDIGSHKSDFGGVRLNLEDTRQVTTSLNQIARAAEKTSVGVKGFLVEEQAAEGIELVLGGIYDPRFGPCMMVGLGGIFVEVFEDIAFRVCPIREQDAMAMLNELHSSELLKGARGRRAIDFEALVAAMMAFGSPEGLLMALEEDAAEVDINPLIVTPNGVTAVDARILLSPDSRKCGEKAPQLDELETQNYFRPLFEPEDVAIIGASTSGTSFGNEMIRHSLAFGYKGKLIPVHPKAATVEGLQAVSSLSQLKKPVDFAYVAIGADAALDAIREAPGKARFVQVMSSGFGESEKGVLKEQQLVEIAQAGGFRLIGPNCLGVHCPRGGITFVGGADPSPGNVGIISQSGGLAVDIILHGQERGLKFSSVVTLGNSADLQPVDLLEFHFADRHTDVVGFYLEGVGDGRRFVQRLIEFGERKPVVLLVGGRTDAGRRAAASHTGSLAADARIWHGIAEQTGAIIVDTLEEFVTTLLVMQMRSGKTNRPLRNVAIFGNGGGSSVLAADAFAAAGMSVAKFSEATQEKLDALDLPPGTSLANPIDTPAGTLRHRDGAVAGEILRYLVEEPSLDAIVLHVNLPVFLTSINQQVDVIGGLVREVTEIRKERPDATPMYLVLRSDGSRLSDDRRRSDRQTALEAGVPVFDTLPEAAQALGRLAHFSNRNFADTCG